MRPTLTILPVLPIISVILNVSEITLNSLILCLAVILGALALLKTGQQLLRQNLPVLAPAFRWGLATQCLWLVATGSSLPFVPMGDRILDQLWYWAAVLSCCPAISVLGARRPTSSIWTWFIILPLIAVLGWPAVTALVHFPQILPVRVQLPVLIGFVIVLIMGGGNYLGTRYALGVLLIATATLMVLWPVTTYYQGETARSGLRAWGPLLFSTGILWGFQQAARPTSVESGFDRVWFDFCDAFGIVWSIRIQDRINRTAEQEQWAARLGTEGFVWDSPLTKKSRQYTEDRMRHTLHWLLRRFVEPDWIDSRLAAGAETITPGVETNRSEEPSSDFADP